MQQIDGMSRREVHNLFRRAAHGRLTEDQLQRLEDKYEDRGQDVPPLLKVLDGLASEQNGQSLRPEQVAQALQFLNQNQNGGFPPAFLGCGNAPGGPFAPSGEGDGDADGFPPAWGVNGYPPVNSFGPPPQGQTVDRALAFIIAAAMMGQGGSGDLNGLFSGGFAGV